MANNNNHVFQPGPGVEQLSSTSTAKSLHLIFLVDNSGSMRINDSGDGKTRIVAVNEAFENMIPKLQELQEDVRAAFTMYISILMFNESPEWHVRWEPIETYNISEIPVSPYVTYYSRAYQELNENMSRSNMFSQDGKQAEPYIMLMTDGAPTEGDPYEEVLEELMKNRWFEGAQRYAVLIGNDTIHDPSAREAVRGFVTEPVEGIINAADAQEIMNSVSAKTMRILDNMTHRANPNGGVAYGGDNGYVFDPFGLQSGGADDNGLINNGDNPLAGITTPF